MYYSGIYIHVPDVKLSPYGFNRRNRYQTFSENLILLLWVSFSETLSYREANKQKKKHNDNIAAKINVHS